MSLRTRVPVLIMACLLVPLFEADAQVMTEQDAVRSFLSQNPQNQGASVRRGRGRSRDPRLELVAQPIRQLQPGRGEREPVLANGATACR